MSSPEQTTRDRILDATIHLMETHGGKGVRMSDIARAANVSRQAVYLHFDNRADLLVAATRRNDDLLKVEERLEPSRNAPTGRARITSFIAFWGDHVPLIYPLAKALLAMRDTDEAVAAAWDERMAAVRDGCAAALQALAEDGDLAPGWDIESATDLFAAMLSIRTWEQLTQHDGWSRDAYVARLQMQALATFAMP